MRVCVFPVCRLGIRLVFGDAGQGDRRAVRETDSLALRLPMMRRYGSVHLSIRWIERSAPHDGAYFDHRWKGKMVARAEGEMDDTEGNPTVTIGPLLQEARTAKGLTIEAAAAASKVPLSFVRLMEQEQFHLVPDLLYLIRFMTEYCVFLGLDPKQVEAQWKDQENASRVSGPSLPVSLIGSQIDLRRLLPYLLSAAVAIPLIFIGLSLLSGRPPAPPLESQQTAASTPEAGTATLPGPQSAAVGAGQPEGVNPTSPLTDPAAQRHQAPPPRYELKAEAKKRTRLGISADGAPRIGVLLHAGETAQWSANEGFVVTIGKSGEVALMLNGRPISLEREGGQRIRKLALPENGGPPLAGR